MTSYRSPLANIGPMASVAASPEPTEAWDDTAGPKPDDYEDDVEYNPYGYKYFETTAERLRPGQVLCWTESDGWLVPPQKVLDPYNARSRTVVLDRGGERDNWSLRGYTVVRYLDTTPVFNDWGEEGL